MHAPGLDGNTDGQASISGVHRHEMSKDSFVLPHLYTLYAQSQFHHLRPNHKNWINLISIYFYMTAEKKKAKRTFLFFSMDVAKIGLGSARNRRMRFRRPTPVDLTVCVYT